MTTTLFEVRGLIERLSPKPVCDECIADWLHRSATSHANTKARELAGANGFERALGVFSLHGGLLTVIQRWVA